MIFEGTFEKIECGPTSSDGHACSTVQFRGNIKNLICDNHSCSGAQFQGNINNIICAEHSCSGAKFNAVSEITTCGDHSCSRAEFLCGRFPIPCPCAPRPPRDEPLPHTTVPAVAMVRWLNAARRAGWVRPTGDCRITLDRRTRSPQSDSRTGRRQLRDGDRGTGDEQPVHRNLSSPIHRG